MIAAVALAGPTNYPFEKTKSYTERFTVQNNVQVSLDNLFGDIIIDTWDKNVVLIEAIVTVEGEKELAVDKQIEMIDVLIAGNRNAVSSKTSIKQYNAGKWKNTNLEYSIHYKVFMPKTGNVQLSNKYGDVTLDELMGSSDFTVKYGSLHIDDLNGKENKIDLFYGRGSDIGNCKNANVSLSYSGLEIENGGTLNVIAKYSDLDIENTNKLKYYGRYDKLTVEDCAQANIDSKYSSLKLENLLQLLEADIQHSNLSVGNVSKGFEAVTVSSSYGPVTIAFAQDADFEFNANSRHCQVSTPSEATLTNKQKDYSCSSYKGFVGNQSSKSKVSVTSEYGSVKLKVD